VPEIRVDPNALAGAGQQLQAAGTTLGTIAASARGVRTGAMTGDGACDGALAEAVHGWGNVLAELEHLLSGLASATHASSRVYAETDRNAVRRR
jgi:hypothetical protein